MSGEIPAPDLPPPRPHTTAHPRFRSTEHLASEAVAAYVDGELRMNAYLRAAQHLTVCAECTAEVEAQQQARIALRRAAHIAIPHSLQASLTQIPQSEPTDTRRSTPSSPSFSGWLSGSFPTSFDSRRWTTWWRK